MSIATEQKGFIVDAKWPTAEAADPLVSRKAAYVRDTAHALRTALQRQQSVAATKKVSVDVMIMSTRRPPTSPICL